ncbi:MAG: anti-sigma factor, partial [Deltaproteobacteria bacterium]|nr:anti-sigma factor [Deltaproteobacteria bacterium]
MNHQELKDLLPLYVLGGLDAESVAALQHHLTEEACDSCAAELRQWQEVVGLLPLGVTPDGPSTAVKARLMARVQQDLGAKVVPLRPRRLRAVWVAVPLAAAAAVFLLIGGQRYHAALKLAAEQTSRAETLAVLLAQAQEKLAGRETDLQQLTARLEAQQAEVAAQARAIAQFEAALTEQRRLVSLREQELARAQQSRTAEEKAVEAKYEGEIVTLNGELVRQRAVVSQGERELSELRGLLAQQRAEAEASGRETTQLRDALARQRNVIEVLTAPGLRIGYLRQAKSGVPTAGHVLWNERKKAWLFYAFGMPQPPPGKEYQVWFMTEKEGPVSAGLFTPDQ